MTRRVTTAVLVPVLALTALAACGDDGDPSTSSPAGSAGTAPDGDPSTTPAGTDAGGGEVSPVVAGEPFPADRCAANQAAGTIVYLSSFDFAATASIVEVLVAEEKGYFDDLCLDVELRPSFSTANYPEIAAGNAQFSSAGAFSEVIDYAAKNEAPFVAVAVEGKTGIDALIVKAGQATDLEDLRGATIGVKGAITRSVAAMLQQAGLVEGTDYTTVLLDGFDPKVHIEVPNIVGFPGYKSNEPKQLEAAGIPFDLFDPADYDIPGSFGVLYTNADFLAAHPTAVEDFLRASMLGLQDAIADPAEAAEIAIGMINANGNAMFLSPEGEAARWGVEAELLVSTNAVTGTPIGVPDTDLLTDEVTTYAEIGLFGGETPSIDPFVALDPMRSVYGDDLRVIWPKV